MPDLPPPLVPAGTCCRLRVQIRPGADGPLTRSNKSPALYLLLAFTVTEPEQFAGVKLERPEDLNGIEILALVGIRQRSFRNADGPTENYITGVVVPGSAS